MEDYKYYRRTNLAEMKPWLDWLVAERYFNDNFAEVEVSRD